MTLTVQCQVNTKFTIVRVHTYVWLVTSQSEALGWSSGKNVTVLCFSIADLLRDSQGRLNGQRGDAHGHACLSPALLYAFGRSQRSSNACLHGVADC